MSAVPVSPLGPSVQLEDLKRVLMRLQADDVRPYFDVSDGHQLRKVVSIVASTLDEVGMAGDIERAMRHTAEAMAILSYLRSSYDGKKRTAIRMRDRRKFVTYTNAQDDLSRGGNRVTDAKLEAALSGDDNYTNLVAMVDGYEVLANLFTDLKFDLKHRLDVQLEISRNKRAEQKDN